MTFAVLHHERIEFGQVGDDGIRIDESIPVENLEQIQESTEQWLGVHRNQKEMTFLLSGCHAFARTLSIGKRLRKNRKAIAFGIEEFLPISAEEIDADFIRGSSLVVAASDEKIVKWLEELGTSVCSIACTGFRPLLAARLIIDQKLAPDDCTIVLVSDTELDIIGVCGRAIEQWNWIPREAGQDVSLDVNLFLTQWNRPVYLFGKRLDFPVPVDTEIHDQTGQGPGITELALQMSQRICKGSEYPVVDVPSMQCVRLPGIERAAALLVVALAILVSGIAVFLFSRTHQLKAGIETIEHDIQRIYESSVPEGPDTPLIKRALETRLRELETLSTIAGQWDRQVNVRSELFRVVSALPENPGYRIDRINIHPSGTSVIGKYTGDSTFNELVSSFTEAGFELRGNSDRRRNRPLGSETDFQFIREPGFREVDR